MDVGFWIGLWVGVMLTALVLGLLHEVLPCSTPTKRKGDDDS